MSQTVYLKVHDGRHKALPSTIVFMLLRPLADIMLQAHGHDSRLAGRNPPLPRYGWASIAYCHPKRLPTAAQCGSPGLWEGKSLAPLVQVIMMRTVERHGQTAISLSSASSSSSSLDLLGLAAWAGLVWGTLGRGGLACGWA